MEPADNSEDGEGGVAAAKKSEQRLNCVDQGFQDSDLGRIQLTSPIALP